MNTNRMYMIIASVIILGFCIGRGWSIKCWECNSQFDPKCGDPFDNRTLSITDCDQVRELDHLPGLKSSTCRKIRQKVNGEWRYIRSCAYIDGPEMLDDEKLCLTRTGSFNMILEYCTCNSDGCNSSSFLSPKFIMIYSATVFSLTFKCISRFY